MSKQRIAVLGGGLGAMGTVCALTSQPGWDEKFEVTVFQMGWRLGGKGASGRGPDARIQEHGLHLWLGFYENAFRLMRDVFAELDGVDGIYHSIEEAFVPMDEICIMDRYSDGWGPWKITFPRRDSFPGDGKNREQNTIWDVVVLAFEEFIAWIESALGHPQHAEPNPPTDHKSFLADLAERVISEIGEAGEELAESFGRGLLHAAHAIVRLLPRDAASHPESAWHALLAVLDRYLAHLKQKLEEDVHDDPMLRHVFTVTDILTASMRGMLENRVLIDEKGFDVLDHLEFQEFLRKYGAASESSDVATCGPVRDLYNLVFAFEGGDPTRPNLAAGVALRGAVSILFLYKQSIAHRMNAGMGDTIFTPFYKLLKARGVIFKFFHRLENMELSEVDGDTVVERLDFAVQATPRTGEYDPFVRVGDLDCWPQAPLVEQLLEGEAIKAGPDGDGVDGWDGDGKGYDLEDFWTTWKNPGKLSIERGTDFDLVLLAIPPAAHRFIAPQLLEKNREWAEMTEKVVAIRTLAGQLWMNATLEKAGWKSGRPLLAAYQEPFDTWTDMSHLLKTEGWSGEDRPHSISYICGSMMGALPGRHEHGVREKADAEVERIANHWLETASGTLWPDISDGPAMKPDALYVGTYNAGSGLMMGQYHRANVSPSELYVASHAGTIGYRKDAADTGCTNLYVAGDWTKNSVNAGCVEASIISGLRASNAISGYPALKDIVTYWSASDT